MMKYLLIFLAFLSAVSAENSNCTNEEISGFWLFEESDPVGKGDINCPQDGEVPKPTHQVKFKLEPPNIVTDAFGNKGTWTSIYGYAIEVTVNYRKYFAFLDFSYNENFLTSKCNETKTGLSHDVLVHDWACIRGRKVGSFEDTTSFISRGKTHKMGPHTGRFPGARIFWKPPTAPASEEIKRLASHLPESFDWRNVSGVNYLPPVTSQRCGDCYAHASVGSLASRVRIATNNTQKPVLSVQQIIDCSVPNYSGGCEGGWPYTIAGMFAEEYGLLEEECYPYKGSQGDKCLPPSVDSPKCKERVYAAKFNYIGGYYGGCNEEGMMLDLINNGPFGVAISANENFQAYTGGIFSGCDDPYAQLNHAVVVVGYGVDKESKKKYWIVRNSWSKGWGVDGHILMERGVDMCGIESMGLSVKPIPVI